MAVSLDGRLPRKMSTTRATVAGNNLAESGADLARKGMGSAGSTCPRYTTHEGINIRLSVSERIWSDA